VFGEKDIGHPAITEYLSLTGQGKLQNRKIISRLSERKQNFLHNSKQQWSSTKNLFSTETEVTVVDENEVEGSDTENEQEERTEPVNVVELAFG
jgi:hypothetical protein